MSLVRAFIARDTLEAHFVRDLLVREGIPATILGEHLEAVIGDLPRDLVVCVPPEHEGAARAVTASFHNRAARQIARTGPLWRCPECGERHEPQFDSCWNCGAARPEGEGPEIEPVDPQPIELDLRCTGCKYNLRGLPPRGRCPECGQPIVKTLLKLLANWSADPDENDVATPLRRLVEAAAHGTGYPPEAVLFLLEAWMRALAEVATSQESARARAVAMCWTVADVALEQFDTLANALQTLRKWGIEDCHELARTLFVLIEHGLLDRVDWLRTDDFPQGLIEWIFPPRSVSDVQL